MNPTPDETPVPLTPETVLARRRPPAVEWVEIDGEAVVWSDEPEALHRLDPIATLVFQLCDGVTPLRQTVAELADAFGQRPEVVAPDVTRCAAGLCRNGLVEVTR